MYKSNKFSGYPIISQVIKLLDRTEINRTAFEYKTDRYYKHFKTMDHLTTMVYVVLSGCNSLRELSSIMLACEGRINHLGLQRFPKCSTISDANRKRSSKVFSAIYYNLYEKYRNVLSGSRKQNIELKELKIIDLIKFLNSPESDWSELTNKTEEQSALF